MSQYPEVQTRFYVGDHVRIVRINNPGINAARDMYLGRTGTVSKIIKSRGTVLVNVPGLGAWEAYPENLELEAK